MKRLDLFKGFVRGWNQQQLKKECLNQKRPVNPFVNMKSFVSATVNTKSVIQIIDDFPLVLLKIWL